MKSMKSRQKVKSIYIADSYSLNTGDIGILVATVAEIRRTMPGRTIHIESSHPEALKEYDLDCAIFPRIFDISGFVGTTATKVQLIKAYLAGLYDSLTFLLFAITARFKLPAVWWVRPSRRAQARAIQTTDLWLSSGGGYLSSYYRPEFRFYGYFLAMTMRIPYLIFAQSVGPFFGKLHTSLARFFLNRAASITIREDDSYRYMQTLGLKKPFRLTADIAFLLPVSKDLRIPVPTKKAVALCIKRGNQKYEQSMLQAAKTLQAKGYAVYFVSQTPDDDELTEKLHALHAQTGAKSTNIPFGLDARQVKRLYGACELVIATRMHALIFATEQHVPWIGIGYEPKFRGLSRQLGETGILIEEKDLTPEILEQAIDRMLRRTTQQKSSQKHPAQQLSEQAKENTNILLHVMESEA
jgi:colanic acid/amylovoran biosynthesis protein